MTVRRDPPTSFAVDVPAAELLNGFIGTHVLYALIMTGGLDVLEQAPAPLPIADLVLRTNTDETTMRSLLRTARRIGLVVLDATERHVLLTDRGREAYRVRGYFTATVGGFGDIFRDLDSIAAGVDVFGQSTFQDGHLTALGCAQNWTFQQPIFDAATAGLEFSQVTDLGCGAAARLIHLVASRPGVTGVGIDLSGEACQLARENVKLAGLDDRITILQADLLDVVRRPQDYQQAAESDFVTSYFILHHFAESQVDGRGFLSALREAFPAAGHFVLADAFREPMTDPALPAPLFTLAYQLFHDCIGVSLQTHEQERELFAEAGFDIAAEVPFGHPLEWLFVLRPNSEATLP